MSSSSDLPSRVPVAIVGAGPVGLSLAVGLAHFGIRSAVVEKNASISERSKAAGVHMRTREVFRQWRIEERFLEAGNLEARIQLNNAAPGKGPFSSIDFTDLEVEADRPGLLMLEQSETERILLNIVEDSDLSEVYFETTAVALHQDKHGVTLTVSENNEEREIQASYVVGCDGASSFVRDELGLPFEGITYAVRPVIADVAVKDSRDALPWPRLDNSRDALTVGIRLREGLWRIIHITHDNASENRDVPDAKVQSITRRVLGIGEVDVVWASRFRIHKRSSPRFRVDRVLLAGDAAHVHSPVGGQGMNAGIQDAHNLAWKLASALNDGDADRLLNSYETERRSVVVESVSRFTDIVTRLFLQAPAPIRAAAFAVFRMALKVPTIRRKSLRRITMLDLGYRSSELIHSTDLSAGERLPNPVLRTRDGHPHRLYDLLPPGAALLRIGLHQQILDDLPIEKVIRVGPGAHADPSGLIRRLLRGSDGWILIRPDAHVAWARSDLDDGGRDVYRALGISTHKGKR